MNGAANNGLRFRCLSCSHSFLCETLPTGPEGCPECGGLSFEELTPSPARVAEALSVVAFAVAIRNDFSTKCGECLGSGFLSSSDECHACLDSGRAVAPLFVAEIHPRRNVAPTMAQRLRAEFAYLALTRAPKVVECGFDYDNDTGRITPCLGDSGGPCALCAPPEPRRCTPPQAASIAPPMPSLSRVDPDSRTWRAMRETSIATVRPGAAS